MEGRPGGRHHLEHGGRRLALSGPLRCALSWPHSAPKRLCPCGRRASWHQRPRCQGHSVCVRRGLSPPGSSSQAELDPLPVCPGHRNRQSWEDRAGRTEQGPSLTPGKGLKAAKRRPSAPVPTVPASRKEEGTAWAQEEAGSMESFLLHLLPPQGPRAG